MEKHINNGYILAVQDRSSLAFLLNNICKDIWTNKIPNINIGKDSLNCEHVKDSWKSSIINIPWVGDFVISNRNDQIIISNPTFKSPEVKYRAKISGSVSKGIKQTDGVGKPDIAIGLTVGGVGYIPNANSTSKFIRPCPGPITSKFGWRTHPIYGTSKFHTGIDIGAATGTHIVASDGGTVISSGWINGYGYTVIISHGNGVETLYGHCSKLHVVVKDEVKQGEHIADVGSTGQSTGPHLHFDIKENGNYVDPLNYFK